MPGEKVKGAYKVKGEERPRAQYGTWTKERIKKKGAGEKIEEAAKGAGEKVEKVARGAGEKLKGLLGKTEEKVGDWAEKASKSEGSILSSLKGLGGAIATRAKKTGRHWWDEFKDRFASEAKELSGDIAKPGPVREEDVEEVKEPIEEYLPSAAVKQYTNAIDLMLQEAERQGSINPEEIEKVYGKLGGGNVAIRGFPGESAFLFMPKGMKGFLVKKNEPRAFSNIPPFTVRRVKGKSILEEVI